MRERIEVDRVVGHPVYGSGRDLAIYIYIYIYIYYICIA
jgi:hypothetical protein